MIEVATSTPAVEANHELNSSPSSSATSSNDGSSSLDKRKKKQNKKRRKARRNKGTPPALAVPSSSSSLEAINDVTLDTENLTYFLDPMEWDKWSTLSLPGGIHACNSISFHQAKDSTPSPNSSTESVAASTSTSTSASTRGHQDDRNGYCLLCGLKVSTEANWRRHCEGSHHQQTFALLARVQQMNPERHEKVVARIELGMKQEPQLFASLSVRQKRGFYNHFISGISKDSHIDKSFGRAIACYKRKLDKNQSASAGQHNDDSIQETPSFNSTPMSSWTDDTSATQDSRSVEEAQSSFDHSHPGKSQPGEANESENTNFAKDEREVDSQETEIPIGGNIGLESVDMVDPVSDTISLQDEVTILETKSSMDAFIESHEKKAEEDLLLLTSVSTEMPSDEKSSESSSVDEYPQDHLEELQSDLAEADQEFRSYQKDDHYGAEVTTADDSCVEVSLSMLPGPIDDEEGTKEDSTTINSPKVNEAPEREETEFTDEGGLLEGGNDDIDRDGSSKEIGTGRNSGNKNVGIGGDKKEEVEPLSTNLEVSFNQTDVEVSLSILPGPIEDEASNKEDLTIINSPRVDEAWERDQTDYCDEGGLVEVGTDEVEGVGSSMEIDMDKTVEEPSDGNDTHSCNDVDNGEDHKEEEQEPLSTNLGGSVSNLTAPCSHVETSAGDKDLREDSALTRDLEASVSSEMESYNDANNGNVQEAEDKTRMAIALEPSTNIEAGFGNDVEHGNDQEEGDEETSIKLDKADESSASEESDSCKACGKGTDQEEQEESQLETTKSLPKFDEASDGHETDGFCGEDMQQPSFTSPAILSHASTDSDSCTELSLLATVVFEQQQMSSTEEESTQTTSQDEMEYDQRTIARDSQIEVPESIDARKFQQMRELAVSAQQFLGSSGVQDKHHVSPRHCMEQQTFSTQEESRQTNSNEPTDKAWDSQIEVPEAMNAKKFQQMRAFAASLGSSNAHDQHDISPRHWMQIGHSRWISEDMELDEHGEIHGCSSSMSVAGKEASHLASIERSNKVEEIVNTFEVDEKVAAAVYDGNALATEWNAPKTNIELKKKQDETNPAVSSDHGPTKVVPSTQSGESPSDNMNANVNSKHRSNGEVGKRNETMELNDRAHFHMKKAEENSKCAANATTTTASYARRESVQEDEKMKNNHCAKGLFARSDPNDMRIYDDVHRVKSVDNINSAKDTTSRSENWNALPEEGDDVQQGNEDEEHQEEQTENCVAIAEGDVVDIRDQGTVHVNGLLSTAGDNRSVVIEQCDEVEANELAPDEGDNQSYILEQCKDEDEEIEQGDEVEVNELAPDAGESYVLEKCKDEEEEAIHQREICDPDLLIIEQSPLLRVDPPIMEEKRLDDPKDRATACIQALAFF